MPDQNENSRLWEAIRALEFRLNTHKHTEADLTSAIDIPEPPEAAAVYAGFVESDGTAQTPFPDGWTSARPNTGEYVVTHNFGSTDYIVIPGLINNVHIGTLAIGSNSFTLILNANVSPFAATNSKFTFIVIVP